MKVVGDRHTTHVSFEVFSAGKREGETDFRVLTVPKDRIILLRNDASEWRVKIDSADGKVWVESVTKEVYDKLHEAFIGHTGVAISKFHMMDTTTETTDRNDRHDRAARLLQEAERLGMDHPSEKMIADLIWETEFDTLNSVEETAKRHGHSWIDGKLHNADLAKDGDAKPVLFEGKTIGHVHRSKFDEFNISGPDIQWAGAFTTEEYATNYLIERYKQRRWKT